MPNYRLVCSNRSAMHCSFAVYQSPPPTNSPGQMISLAWMARPAAPNTRVSFAWSTTPSFIWAEAGSTSSGCIFEASQTVEANPFRENVIDLAQDSFGAPHFQNLRVGGQPGTMTIHQMNNVFDFPVSIGIGMANKPAYAVTSNPNISTCFIPQQASYWVVFGSFSTGEVFDIESISGALAVTFDPMAPTQYVVLAMDNILRRVPGS
jgi:rhizosphere induced protein